MNLSTTGIGRLMRNRFPGTCYRCGKTVKKDEGHFERNKGSWRVQHVTCCLEHKAKKEEERVKT